MAKIKVKPQIIRDVIETRITQGQTSTLFRIEDDPQNILDLLTKHYAELVLYRGGIAELDEETNSNLVQVANALAEPEHPGIWMCGDVGNGKTTMLQAISRTIYHYRCTRDYSHLEWYERPITKFVSAKEIWEICLKKAQSGYYSARDADWQYMEQVPILFIDDVGREASVANSYQNPYTPVADLIWSRYHFNKTIMVSSNLLPGEVLDKYDKLVADRCKEQFHIVKFTANSYRGRTQRLKPM